MPTALTIDGATPRCPGCWTRCEYLAEPNAWRCPLEDRRQLGPATFAAARRDPGDPAHPRQAGEYVAAARVGELGRTRV